MAKDYSAKRVVEFRMTEDAVNVGQADWGAAIRAPIPLEIPPGETRMVDTGIEFKQACLIYPGRTLLDIAEVHFLAAIGNLLLPETRVYLSIKNTHPTNMLSLEAKETVAYALFVWGPEEMRKIP